LLNVPGHDAVEDALREIWWSANSDSAITYRQRVGLFRQPSVGVVVQSLLDPDCAGVMFTRNPINGADERVIEASWGLGEAVVAGLVIPDHFRIDRSGNVLERRAGLKRIAIRKRPDGGTVEEELTPELAEQLCLDDAQLLGRGARGPGSRMLARPGTLGRRLGYGMAIRPCPSTRSLWPDAEMRFTRSLVLSLKLRRSWCLFRTRL
jgi:phosphoenolpyruvate synthase/pyruvate phosphate dikinase